MSDTEHRTVLIIGGGPAGLPLAAVLDGQHPYYSGSEIFRQRYAQMDGFLGQFDGSLLGLDFRQIVQVGLQPVDLFRMLHHPRQKFESLDQVAMEFRQGPGLDWALLSREKVGGLWNNAPRNLLTLSPGQWMEFAFHPLARHAEEVGWDIDVNDLIVKTKLIDYYHNIPKRFELENRIHTGVNVERVSPHDKGFLVEARDVGDGTARRFTCKYLVYATGQRSVLRDLEVPGEELDWVTSHYDSPDDFPGQRVAVVGGGRSGDWAATELHDAGKQVHYIMRQGPDVHWRLISDSRWGLPYYARIARILESESPQMETYYDSSVTAIAAGKDGGLVTVQTPEGERVIEVDHVVKEIGGAADYSLFEGFAPLQLVEKHDDYRFQVHQVRTQPHSYESVDIPNMYPGGYLAQGIGLVVISMHGTTYAIAGDIMQKEGLLS
jgi:thioredoxin reductase